MPLAEMSGRRASCCVGRSRRPGRRQRGSSLGEEEPRNSLGVPAAASGGGAGRSATGGGACVTQDKRNAGEPDSRP
ncbi:hypothetical protein BS78_05G176700 [Paspalum vaginatum]|nr:hypothetical protein BS78_05G176700 [Paspalum vaginatum]